VRSNVPTATTEALTRAIVSIAPADTVLVAPSANAKRAKRTKK
jgi:hypothetical protein